MKVNYRFANSRKHDNFAEGERRLTSDSLNEIPELHGFVEGLQVVHREDKDEASSGSNAKLSHGREVEGASRVQDLDSVESPVWKRKKF
ncbi:hypothetical protein AVEN_223049-1 [Araneus ventricosus]|uniref:Uncharacterized protein n=1 Tax=Araneus ventricosus TaxID=182803 RepID=A0A4Y2RYZ3_ARAVE|nr:hypothetical protein AVEN_87574-1 [Araneus ventricosus]GBN81095.1 hypothetical protein AVEN_223049-1 [Araneus ventricosus]